MNRTDKPWNHMVHPDQTFTVPSRRHPHMAERVPPILRETGSTNRRKESVDQSVDCILGQALSCDCRRRFRPFAPSSMELCLRMGMLQHPVMEGAVITIQTAVTEFVCYHTRIHPDAVDVLGGRIVSASFYHTTLSFHIARIKRCCRSATPSCSGGIPWRSDPTRQEKGSSQNPTPAFRRLGGQGLQTRTSSHEAKRSPVQSMHVPGHLKGDS